MDNLFDLSGKTALVTGGSRGLGFEIAMAFAERGADIVIASRKLEACEAAAEKIRALGRRSLAVATHAGKWDEVNALIDRSYEEFGDIDILVNNAGMSPAVDSYEMTEELFDKIVSLNFKGPFRLSSEIGRRMMDANGGTIINVSSASSYKPMPRVVPYAGSKAALNAMTIGLAHEYGPKVRVNAITAGPFLTDISKAWTEEQRTIAPNAVRRPGRPEEIVTTALYLASDASSFVTGAIIHCDGGLR